MPAKVTPDPKVADQNELLVDLISRRGGLLAGSWIDCSKVHLQAVERGVALGRRAFLEDLAVELLHQEHGGATRQHVIISREFFPRRSRRKERDDFLLWQRRFACENHLGRKRSSIHVDANRVIPNQGSAM